MQNKVIPSHFFKVQEQSLVSLVCQGKRQFVIPYNQRPWSWKEKQINDLWDDILKTCNAFYYASDIDDSWIERSEPIANPHFMGAFVFEEKANNYSVVDGQQRLTSITMLVSALRMEIEKIIMDTEDTKLKRNARHYSDIFKRWLISDFSDDIIYTRLEVDKNYQEFFKGYIIEPENSKEQKEFLSDFTQKLDLSQEPTLSSFKKFFDFIIDKVDSFLKKSSNLEKKYIIIKSIMSIIEDCLICVAADVKKESFSYEVFKCLNAKGLPLNQADKLKNELFTQCSIRDHEEIKRYWDIISENTPYSAVAQFIRIRHVALFNECPESKLHEVITTNELKGNNIPNIIEEWSKDSRIFSEITLEKTSNEKFNSDEKKILNDLKNLKITLSSILVFSAYKKFFHNDRSKFLECLRITRNFCFRSLTICKKGTDFLESHLGRAARQITNGVPLKDVRQNLRNASSNEEFLTQFKTFSTNQARLQFYILESLEEIHLKSSGLKPKSHGEELNIEHIMPKKFDKKESRSSEWMFAKNQADAHKAYLNRIGNLCLLEGGINKDVSSFDFHAKSTGNYPEKFNKKPKNQKRLCYTDSILPSVKKLITDYDYWDFESIDDRQSKMSNDALIAWSLEAPSP